MNKALLITVIVGVCLLIAGGAVFAVAMNKVGWNFGALSENVLEVTKDSFAVGTLEKIVVDVNTQDVYFYPTDEDEISIEGFVLKNKDGDVLHHTVIASTETVLNISDETLEKTIFNIDVQKEKVVVKVPKDKAFDVVLKVSTGKVIFGEEGKETNVTSLQIVSSTGNVSLLGKTICQDDLSVERSTGKLMIKGVVVCGGDIAVTSSTGKTELDAPISAKQIEVNATTGYVKGEGVLSFDSLKITVGTGDVSVKVSGTKNDYTYIYDTSTGKSNVSSYSAGEKHIDIQTSTGDIDLCFEE